MRNSKLKKLLSMALCGVMVLGMTACSGSDGDTDNTTTTAKQEETSAQEQTTENAADDVDLSSVLVLACNVMYNDADSAYYGNEVGPSIEVTGDGQYTVTFDCATDLSDAAKSAGVKGLKYLTAIYIKDYSVTNGKLGASNLSACNIQYDKIVVDGVELTITSTEPKNAIKTSGIFDTNDPINSWDGSAVAEVDLVDADAHVINLTTNDSPQKIEITFTLSGLTFK